MASMDNLLSMLYPQKQVPQQALQSLFGFGPQESFNLLRSMKVMPTELEGLKEDLQTKRLKNLLTHIGIPQKEAEVSSFLKAPQALQFFGPGNYNESGVADYQDPLGALRRSESKTGLTEAQGESTRATAGRTRAETSGLLQEQEEAGRYGGPANTATLFKLLSARPDLIGMFGAGGFDERTPIPQTSKGMFEEDIYSKAVKELQGGKLNLVNDLLDTLDPKRATAVIKQEAEMAKTESKRQSEQAKIDNQRMKWTDPATGRKYEGPFIEIAPTIAQSYAEKRFRTDPDRFREAFPGYSDTQITEALAKVKLYRMKSERTLLKEGNK